MSPSELIQAGKKLFGPKWRQPMADALQVDLATIRRWTGGYVQIDRRTELAIRALLAGIRTVKGEASQP